MSQVYSITFNGLGLTPYSQLLVTRLIQTEINGAQLLLSGWRSMLLRTNEKNLVRIGVTRLEAIRANPGDNDAALEASIRDAAALIDARHANVQNRLQALVVGSVIAGLGGYLYFRKR